MHKSSWTTTDFAQGYQRRLSSDSQHHFYLSIFKDNLKPYSSENLSNLSNSLSLILGGLFILIYTSDVTLYLYQVFVTSYRVTQFL